MLGIQIKQRGAQKGWQDLPQIFHTLSLAKKQFLESQESRDKAELSLWRVDIRLSFVILGCPKKLLGWEVVFHNV